MTQFASDIREERERGSSLCYIVSLNCTFSMSA